MSRSVFNRWLRVFCAVGIVAVMLVSGSRGQALAWRGFEKAMTVADSTNRLVMVDVHAPWCGWCRRMKAEVYPSDAVRTCLVDNFVLTRLNRDDTETTLEYQGRRLTPRQLASHLRADEVPTTVLLSPRGEYLLHLSGFIKPAPLRSVLSYISTGAYQHTSFEAYRSQSSPQCESSRNAGDGRSGHD